MFFDIAMAWDKRRRRCDMVYQRGRLVIDRTPVTPMLVALGCERRAELDDALPDATTEGSLQSGRLDPRRGWQGDWAGTGAGGGRCGSRLWLEERAKLASERGAVNTLGNVEDYAVEALARLGAREALDVDAAASRAGHDAMLLQAAIGTTVLPIRLATA